MEHSPSTITISKAAIKQTPTKQMDKNPSLFLYFYFEAENPYLVQCSTFFFSLHWHPVLVQLNEQIAEILLRTTSVNDKQKPIKKQKNIILAKDNLRSGPYL